MTDRSKTITANFDEIEQAFILWSQQTKDGDWRDTQDDTARAEHFITLIGEIQAGAH